MFLTSILGSIAVVCCETSLVLATIGPFCRHVAATQLMSVSYNALIDDLTNSLSTLNYL